MHGPVRLAALAVALVAAHGACSSKRDDTGRAPTATRAPAADAAPPASPRATAVADASAATPAEPSAARPPATAPPAPAADAPTNLQVLPRSWSRERVELYMRQRVARGLGVECTYCHDRRDFAADGERKRAARAMIAMTFEINRDFFSGQQRIGCPTCHDGKPTPATGEPASREK